MLKSSLIILLIINIFFDKIIVVGGVTLLLLILSLIYNKDLKKNLSRVKFLFFLYFMTCLLQIFYTQEGKVIFKIYSIYVTEEGVKNFLINFLRIGNLLMLSWIITAQKLITSGFTKYQQIIETVIELVPQALLLIKKRMKIKWFFRYILKQIKVKN